MFFVKFTFYRKCSLVLKSFNFFEQKKIQDMKISIFLTFSYVTVLPVLLFNNLVCGFELTNQYKMIKINKIPIKSHFTIDFTLHLSEIKKCLCYSASLYFWKLKHYISAVTVSNKMGHRQ